MQNKTIHQVLLIAVTLASSSSALSKGISYDFIQGTYVSSSIETSTGTENDGDGLGISGSFSVAPEIAITASYDDEKIDTPQGSDIDSTSLAVGATVYSSGESGTSAFANISALRREVDTTHDSGFIMSFGLRHMPGSVLELELNYSSTVIFDDTDHTVGVGARFFASENISLGIGYETSSDIDSILLNARFNL